MVTYYEILGLPSSRDGAKYLTPQLLKEAYRKSLLQHHPDKAHHVSSPGNGSTKTANKQPSSAYTVDQITKAYSVISTPKLREEYDRELALQTSQTGEFGAQQQNGFRTGVEIVDLDDLEFDEKESLWFRSCRCGDDRGFLIREEDLEEAVDDGELAVGCRGCSLWLRVLFGVVEESDQNAPAGNGNG
jgi:DnaJ-class molecular chaperone